MRRMSFSLDRVPKRESSKTEEFDVSAWHGLLGALADFIAAKVERRLRAAAPGMIDQARSPLGARRHCAAVKRRLARGEPGASLVGRKHLLTEEALSEELGRVSNRQPAKRNDANDVRDELERELRLLKGGVG